MTDNNSWNGYKHGAAKNILNTEPTTGSGGISTVSNSGAGVPIGSVSGSNLNLQTLTGGNNITVTSNGSTITIAESASSSVTPIFFDQSTYYISKTHPQAGVAGSRVYLSFTTAIAALPSGPGSFQLLVAPGVYTENPSYTGNLDLSIVGLSTFQLAGTLTLTLLSGSTKKTIGISAAETAVITNVNIGAGSNDLYSVKLINCNFTSLTDSSANLTSFSMETSRIGLTLINYVDTIYNCYFSSTLTVTNACGNISDTIFISAINISVWYNVYAGFRNSVFDFTSSFTSTQNLQIDSNSYYSFMGNSWTNTSPGVTILELPIGGGVTSIGLTAPSDVFVVGSSPVTSAGTITLSKPTTTGQNLFYAGPSSGGAGAAVFRAIQTSDLPSSDLTTITGPSGTVSTTTTQPYTNVLTSLWQQSAGDTFISYDSMGRVSQVSQQQNFTQLDGLQVLYDYFNDPDLIYPPNLTGNTFFHYFEFRIIIVPDSSLSFPGVIVTQTIPIFQSASNVKGITNNMYKNRVITQPPTSSLFVGFDTNAVPPSSGATNWAFINNTANFQNGKIGIYIGFNDPLIPAYRILIQTNKYMMYA